MEREGMSAVATATLWEKQRAPRRLRLTNEQPEVDLHEDVANSFAWHILPPAEWTTFPAGSVPLPPQFAAKLLRLGLKRGWPDILILHDRMYGLELKRLGGQLSRTKIVRTRRGGWRELTGQEDQFPKLERAGMRIAVAHSVPEALAFLRGWGIPMRVTT
jgi:hypothetical protein